MSSTRPAPATLATPADPPPLAPARWLTTRAVLLGLFLVVAASIVVPLSDYVLRNTTLIGNHLPTVILIFCAVMALVINPLLGAKRFAPGEVLLAVAMLSIACALPASGFFRFFHSLIVTPVKQAAELNSQSYVDALPAWLMPSKDPQSPIIQQFIFGLDPRRGQTMSSTIGPWITPYAAWFVFSISIFSSMIFFCMLMRRQWAVNERLSFPLALIPIEMAAAPTAGHRVADLWRSKLLWLGVAIPLAIHIVNGFHTYSAAVPEIPIKYDLTSSFTDFPLNQIPQSMQKASFYFSFVGVAFFVPMDVLFSLFFFYFAYCLVRMLAASSGTPIDDNAMASKELGLGLAYLAYIFYIARRHLLHIARSAFRGTPREPGEFLSYRWGLVGFLAAVLIATLFLMAAGMQWWTALLVVASVLFASMLLTRIAIEAGILYLLLPYGAVPMNFFHLLFDGRGLLRMPDWAMGALTTRLGILDQRENMMPFAADALRIAADAPPRQKPRIFLLLIAVLALTLVVAGATHHVISYQYGRWIMGNWANEWCPVATMNDAKTGMTPPVNATINRPLNVGEGAVLMLAASLLRLFWSGCPLHPLGLLLCNSATVHGAWLSILIAWACKSALLRWGGAKTFVTTRPFFIGLLVGDAFAVVFWIVMSLFIKWPGASYQVLPG